MTGPVAGGPARAVLVAIDGPAAGRLAAGLEDRGVQVYLSAAAAPARGGGIDLDGVDALVLESRRDTLTTELVARCDRAGVRIVALVASEADRRQAAMIGVGAVRGIHAGADEVVDALATPVLAAEQAPPARVIAVWGPHGAPGRTTLARELAVELARGGPRVALIDADTHAPSLALSLGIPDEGPGFPAACRRAEVGVLDGAELTRIGVPLTVPGGVVEVLTGINRPSRWPEMSDRRVSAALEACRTWADHVVVDVAAPLERDEEIVSDLDGPYRNAATLAVLRAADLVVAVTSADPLGVARFLRGYSELRSVIGAGRVVVAANRLRPGALGVDSRGQVRRTLERFAGVRDVTFLPLDPRSADAAMLAARPIAEIAPRSPFVMAVRRLVGESIAGPDAERRTLRRRRREKASART